MQLQVSASLKWISLVFSARSIGNMAGTLLAGPTYDRVEAPIILCLSLILMSLSCIAISKANVIALLMTAMCILGVATGFSDTGCNIFCLRIWKKDSHPYMQGLHFAFAFGATVSPLLVSPFVSPVAESHPNHTSHLAGSGPSMNVTSVHFRSGFAENFSGSTLRGEENQQTLVTIQPDLRAPRGLNDQNSSSSYGLVVADDTGLSSAPDILDDQSRGLLWIPYGIISAYIFMVSMMFLWLHCRFVGNTNLVKKIKKVDKNGLESKEAVVSGRRPLRIVLIVLLSAFFFFYAPHEAVYGGFIYMYAVEGSQGFSTQMASYLNSAFWGTFAATRGLAICFATRLAPKAMLTINVVGMCSASALLAIFANDNVAALWTGTILLGASMASLYPSGLAWAEGYIDTSGSLTAVLLFVTSASMMALPWVAGILFESVGLTSMMYFILTASGATALVFLAMQIVALRYGKK
ncbi:sodium-dependent glucose transporter 1C-like isoform X2 [Ptychodera flava]